MASVFNQSQSRQSSSSNVPKRPQKPVVVSGVMPWQLQAEMDRRSNPGGSSLSSKVNRGSRNNRNRSSVGSANSASQLQQRLMGGMNLSMAIPRSRPERAPIVIQESGTWSCSICAMRNNWRDGDSCKNCFQNALYSSSNNSSLRSESDVDGGGRSFAHNRRTQPSQEILSSEQWANLEIKAAHRQDEGNSDPCSICLEDFKRGVPQLLLSCSHIFHAQCLRSFEAHQVHYIYIFYVYFITNIFFQL